MALSVGEMIDSSAKRPSRFNEEVNLGRLLNSLDSADQLEFPVCVEHRGQLSPDFVLSTKTTQIGLEVTCSTDEELIRGRQVLKLHPAPFIDVTLLKDGPQRRSNDALKSTMFDLDPAWEDESQSLLHKLRKITEAIDRKRKKFRSQAFTKFPENWLVIFDNYFRFISNDSLAIFKSELFQTLRRSHSDFDRLYIFCGEWSFRWHKGKLSSQRMKI